MKRNVILAIIAAILVVVVLSLTSCSCDGTDDTTTTTPPPVVQKYDPTIPVSAEYLRVIGNAADGTGVVMKFNAAYPNCSFDVRYSEEPITEDNFDSAAKADFSVIGDGIGKTLTVKNFSISLNKAYYVAVKPFVDPVEGEDVFGDIITARVGGNMLLPIDYSKIVNANIVHHGESFRNFSALFDEQREDLSPGNLMRPVSPLNKLYSESDDKNDNDGKPRLLSPVIQLEYLSYVSDVHLYIDVVPKGDIKIRVSKEAVDFQAPDSEWDDVMVFSKETFTKKTWYTFSVDADVQYVQLCFYDGSAPVEIMIYGYQSGDSDHAPAEEAHKLPTMGEMMGICGFVANGGGNTSVSQVSCATVLREYHNMGWSYTIELYPYTATHFNGGMGNFDIEYSYYKKNHINVIPCVQWGTLEVASVFSLNSEGKIVRRAATEQEKYDPDVYEMYADNMFGFAARYGRAKSPELLEILKKHMSRPLSEASMGMDYLDWIEMGNEPNGESQDGFTPYQLAALTSAGYDGHENTMTDILGDSSHFGVKNADPTMKVAMAGLAGVGSRYISSMVYWMKANRNDRQVAMDAFNVHSYFCKEFTINGQKILMGVSPEEFDLIGDLSQLIELRDKYYPEKEVWLTEFGWDTATSYTTKTACHAYGEYTARQVQAMWLTRAYLIMSAAGVDKATMYMCEDGGSEDTTANSQYGTCGVFDYKGNPKDSYYYMYTLRNTLYDYTFVQEIDSGRSDVWIYQFADEDGNYGYALWCPTSDSTKVENFKLYIDADKAVLVENAFGEINGIKTDLTATNKVVTVNVSENPIYVMVGETAFENVLNPAKDAAN
ncbi:MAG: hypothetical protein IKC74_01210 [Clostridia bacterium]|nr:hypothetical protein [Clostridia bacterium]